MVERTHVSFGHCVRIRLTYLLPLRTMFYPYSLGVVEGTCSTVTTVGPTLQELLKNNIFFSGTGDSCAHLTSQVNDFSSSKQGNLMNIFFPHFQ